MERFIRTVLPCLFLTACLCAASRLYAQSSAPDGPAQVRAIDAGQWQKAVGTLDYSKDQPKAPKAPLRSPQWTPDFSWWGKVLQLLAIIAAAALIGYAIYRIMQAPRNKIIARDGVEITVENLEQYLHETDLDRFLAAALQEGNYPLAIRLYYLQAIKNLSQQKSIVWAREKTNRDYQRELANHPQAPAFREATLIYERVWYGNRPLDFTRFEELAPKLKTLVAATTARPAAV